MKKYTTTRLLIITCTLANLFSLSFSSEIRQHSKITDYLPIQLPIFHQQHEGSHAIGATLADIPCVFFIEEQLDKRQFDVENDKNGLARYKLAQKTYYNPQGVNATLLYSHLRKKAIRTDIDLQDQCHSEGLVTMFCALVRKNEVLLNMKNFSWPAYVLIRTDIMRLTLSLASRAYDEDGLKHPQFKKDYQVVKRSYDISVLKKHAEMVIRMWKAVAHTVIGLRATGMPCSLIKLITYEDYLRDNALFAEVIYNNTVSYAVSREIGKTAFGTNAGIQKGYHKEIHKVHSDDIRLFVSNADEVESFFATGEYGDYQSVVSSVPGIDCDVNDILLSPYLKPPRNNKIFSVENKNKSKKKSTKSIDTETIESPVDGLSQESVSKTKPERKTQTGKKGSTDATNFVGKAAMAQKSIVDEKTSESDKVAIADHITAEEQIKEDNSGIVDSEQQRQSPRKKKKVEIIEVVNETDEKNDINIIKSLLGTK